MLAENLQNNLLLGVKFPVHKEDYPKIEKQNNIFINVFHHKDETPYHIYTSKQTFEIHVDLLVLSNSKLPLCFN